MMNTKCGFFLPKQVICLEKIFANLEVLAVLLTGYGKSLIFCLLPALLFAKEERCEVSFHENIIDNYCCVALCGNS